MPLSKRNIDPAAKAGLLRRLLFGNPKHHHRRRDDSFFIILALVIAAHAAVAAFVKVHYFTPPTLELRYGNAAEFDGSGPAAAPTFGASADAPIATPIITPPANSFADATSPTSPAQTLTPPPVEPPSPPNPAPSLDALAGTTETDSLPMPPATPLAPPVNLNRPPIALGPLITDEPRDPIAPSDSTLSNDSTAGVRAAGASTLLASANSPAGNSAATGTNPSSPSAGSPNAKPGPANHTNATDGTHQGKGDGGGIAGVPEGVPMPASDNRSPRYPKKAFDRDWSGTVTLEMDIDTTGRVTDVRILQSSGHDILDREAFDTARSWKFTPARLDGVAIAVTVTRPINFNIERVKR